MATRSKNRSKSRASRRSQRGGAQGSYPDSAWGFQMNNLGNGWTQFMNSLSVQPGANLGTSQSNNIVPIKNINAQNAQPKMAGGKRGRRRAQMQQQMQQQSRGKGRGKKGGYWGAVIEQAAVPLALLGMQQFYGKRHTRRHPGHNRSFKRRH
jgi:hypothetical protein